MKHSKSIQIQPVKTLKAEVTVPGSKSYTQRALVTASLACGSSILENVLLSEDTLHFIDALKSLGVAISFQDGRIFIEGTGGCLKLPGYPMNLGNNGTAMRFLASLVSLGRGKVILTGEDRLCERPIRPLMECLGQLGVTFRYRNLDGFPPVEIQANGLKGGSLRIRNAESSQYISSLLLAAPYAGGPVTIDLEGGRGIVSRPYIGMTLQVMEDFGVKVRTTGQDSYTVPGNTAYEGRPYFVEGDASSASYFFLAAMLCRGVIRVHNLNPKSRQGDLKLIDILKDWGAEVICGKNWVEVRGHGMKAGDLAVDMGDMPDMVPTLAVLSAFRAGITEIRRVSHLRIKESNRLAALVAELGKMGVQTREGEDHLIVFGGHPLHGAVIDTYNDHRIAMSFAAAGLAVPGIIIENPRCVDKSFPDFWRVFENLATGLHED